MILATILERNPELSFTSAVDMDAVCVIFLLKEICDIFSKVSLLNSAVSGTQANF